MHSNLIAKDIIEIIAEARANPNGFRAALKRFKELSEN